MYYFGRGVELDYAIGDVWCRQAAAQGHEQAQAHLDMVLPPSTVATQPLSRSNQTA